MLTVENLSIAFHTPEGLRPTVNDMSMEIGAGEIVGLVGESGSGKTLLSLAILGLLPANAVITSGRVTLDGNPVSTLGPEAMRRLRGNRISMVFQDPMASLDPVFTCGDQIMDAILMHENVGRTAARRRALALLERLQLPDPARAMRAYPHELSGGQCQRVMIAIAVACEPDVIIADEPTTALDVTVQKQVLDILRDLNRDVGAAILLITHDLGVVFQVADRVVVMYRGDKVEEASTPEIFARPTSDYTRALIGAMPTIGQRRDRLRTIGDADAPPRPSAARKAAPAADLPPVLRVEGLSKTYRLKAGPFAPAREFRAVGAVSLSIAPRTTLGLVGESGCGKTTLSRLILQMQKADKGEVWFNGEDLTKLDANRLRDVRRDIALVFQNPYASLNPRQTVAEIVSAPLIIHGRANEAGRTTARLIDAVGLPAASLHKYPHAFSGGQRQRIAIARALALNPLLLVCDEAVSALDVSVQAQVINLLKDLQQEFDLTYLFISHDLAVVEHISDTVAVMRAGRIVEYGPADRIFAAPQQAYTRTLLEAVPQMHVAVPSGMPA
ncbi:dipeptide ABC transporter ATP-binding protein [Aureimonas populi]|uniref:Dipeptide ABC transporter ATP-binding protein n=2 Tax=Aureimonas populi TaxID=1701758 RepID=A0ABW5CPL3_9HYPH